MFAIVVPVALIMRLPVYSMVAPFSCVEKCSEKGCDAPSHSLWALHTGSRTPPVLTHSLAESTAPAVLRRATSPVRGTSCETGQACVLSENRCRAAWRDTPKASAIWFHDLPCAR